MSLKSCNPKPIYAHEAKSVSHFMGRLASHKTIDSQMHNSTNYL